MADTGAEAIGLDYRAQIRADIEACVSSNGCQPILFVGSGLSKRYFSGPSWDELLATLAKQCPLIDKDYAYYKQTLKHPLPVRNLPASTSNGLGTKARTFFLPICSAIQYQNRLI